MVEFVTIMWQKEKWYGQKREKMMSGWSRNAVHFLDRGPTLMYSIGQTAVASIPPAMHPAASGVKGFLAFLDIALLVNCELNGLETTAFYGKSPLAMSKWIQGASPMGLELYEKPFRLEEGHVVCDMSDVSWRIWYNKDKSEVGEGGLLIVNWNGCFVVNWTHGVAANDRRET